MNPQDRRLKWQERFFLSLARPNSLLDLFDNLPGVSLFVKDAQGKYARINQSMAEMFGIDDPLDVVSKTDFDFFPPAIAARYVDEDQTVINSRQPILDKQGFMPGSDGLPRWYVYSKLPLSNHQKQVVGVAGVKHSCEALGDDGSSRNRRLLKVIEYVTCHYGGLIEVADLAGQVDLSVSQLQREFVRILGITPNRYIQEVRTGVARHFLKTTDSDMAHIAALCGFYDQSHFSRQFKASTGLTPMQYRKRYLHA